MKIMKTKKTYEKPSMKEHELRHHASLLAASVPEGINDEIDGEAEDITEGW